MLLAPIFFISFSLTIFTLATSAYHGRFTRDRTTGSQNVHTNKPLRVGGVPILVGLIISLIFQEEIKISPETAKFLKLLLMASLPAFLAGLAEDLTNKVPAAVRLATAIFSGYLCVEIAGVRLDLSNIGLVDSLNLENSFIALFTILIIGAHINAANIIDGANGLSTGIAVTQVLAFGVLTSISGDTTMESVCWYFAAMLSGFLIFNWPFGKIFLGDCGAYIVGLFVICIAMSSTMRNPDLLRIETLLLLSYSLGELAISIVRRLINGKSPFKADHKHMHSLFYRYLLAQSNINGNWMKASNLTGATFVLVHAIFTSIVLCVMIF